MYIRFKNNVVSLLKNRELNLVFRLFILVMIIYLIITAIKWKSFSPQLPLFYSLPRSSDQLGNPFTLMLLPSFSLIFFIGNFVIASYLYSKEKLASFILVISGLVLSILLLITYVKIVLLIA